MRSAPAAWPEALAHGTPASSQLLRQDVHAAQGLGAGGSRQWGRRPLRLRRRGAHHPRLGAHFRPAARGAPRPRACHRGPRLFRAAPGGGPAPEKGPGRGHQGGAQQATGQGEALSALATPPGVGVGRGGPHACPAPVLRAPRAPAAVQAQPDGEGEGEGEEAAAPPAVGSLLVSASRDKTLRVWSMDTNECLAVLVRGAPPPPRATPASSRSAADGARELGALPVYAPSCAAGAFVFG